MADSHHGVCARLQLTRQRPEVGIILRLRLHRRKYFLAPGIEHLHVQLREVGREVGAGGASHVAVVGRECQGDVAAIFTIAVLVKNRLFAGGQRNDCYQIAAQ